MTGEITLRGRVLPIGGLKEKVIAAHRGGIKRIIAPKENKKDWPDVPDEIRDELDVLWIEHMDEALGNALSLEDPEAFMERLKQPILPPDIMLNGSSSKAPGGDGVSKESSSIH